MIKFLGIVDIISSIAIFLMPFKIHIPNSIILIFAIYLLVKSLIFITNPISWIDLAAAVALFLNYFSIFTLPRTAAFILAFLVLQKGIFSILG